MKSNGEAHWRFQHERKKMFSLNYGFGMSHLWVLLETDVFGVGKKNMGLRGTLVFCVCFFAVDWYLKPVKYVSQIK